MSESDCASCGSPARYFVGDTCRNCGAKRGAVNPYQLTGLGFPETDPEPKPAED